MYYYFLYSTFIKNFNQNNVSTYCVSNAELDARPKITNKLRSLFLAAL